VLLGEEDVDFFFAFRFFLNIGGRIAKALFHVSVIKIVMTRNG
jgi:hypothetical protein